MGGRGAASGISNRGKKYGSEYHTILEESNIKFVVPNEGSTTAPLETRTEGRVYVTVNGRNELKFISYYDGSGKKSKQIDLSGKPHEVNGKKILPHTHRGYEHASTRDLTAAEKAMVANVKRIWNNYLSRALV